MPSNNNINSSRAPLAESTKTTNGRCVFGCMDPECLLYFPLNDPKTCNKWLYRFKFNGDFIQAAGGLESLCVCQKHFFDYEPPVDGNSIQIAAKHKPKDPLSCTSHTPSTSANPSSSSPILPRARPAASVNSKKFTCPPKQLEEKPRIISNLQLTNPTIQSSPSPPPTSIMSANKTTLQKIPEMKSTNFAVVPSRPLTAKSLGPQLDLPYAFNADHIFIRTEIQNSPRSCANSLNVVASTSQIAASASRMGPRLPLVSSTWKNMSNTSQMAASTSRIVASTYQIVPSTSKKAASTSHVAAISTIPGSSRLPHNIMMPTSNKTAQNFPNWNSPSFLSMPPISPVITTFAKQLDVSYSLEDAAVSETKNNTSANSPNMYASTSQMMPSTSRLGTVPPVQGSSRSSLNITMTPTNNTLKNIPEIKSSALVPIQLSRAAVRNLVQKLNLPYSMMDRKFYVVNETSNTSSSGYSSRVVDSTSQMTYITSQMTSIPSQVVNITSQIGPSNSKMDVIPTLHDSLRLPPNTMISTTENSFQTSPIFVPVYMSSAAIKSLCQQVKVPYSLETRHVYMIVQVTDSECDNANALTVIANSSTLLADISEMAANVSHMLTSEMRKMFVISDKDGVGDWTVPTKKKLLVCGGVQYDFRITKEVKKVLPGLLKLINEAERIMKQNGLKQHHLQQLLQQLLEQVLYEQNAPSTGIVQHSAPSAAPEISQRLPITLPPKKNHAKSVIASHTAANNPMIVSNTISNINLDIGSIIQREDSSCKQHGSDAWSGLSSESFLHQNAAAGPTHAIVKSETIKHFPKTEASMAVQETINHFPKTEASMAVQARRRYSRLNPTSVVGPRTDMKSIRTSMDESSTVAPSTVIKGKIRVKNTPLNHTYVAPLPNLNSVENSKNIPIDETFWAVPTTVKKGKGRSRYTRMNETTVTGNANLNAIPIDQTSIDAATTVINSKARGRNTRLKQTSVPGTVNSNNKKHFICMEASSTAVPTTVLQDKERLTNTRLNQTFVPGAGNAITSTSHVDNIPMDQTSIAGPTTVINNKSRGRNTRLKQTSVPGTVNSNNKKHFICMEAFSTAVPNTVLQDKERLTNTRLNQTFVLGAGNAITSTSHMDDIPMHLTSIAAPTTVIKGKGLLKNTRMTQNSSIADTANSNDNTSKTCNDPMARSEPTIVIKSKDVPKSITMKPTPVIGPANGVSSNEDCKNFPSNQTSVGIPTNVINRNGQYMNVPDQMYKNQRAIAIPTNVISRNHQYSASNTISENLRSQADPTIVHNSTAQYTNTSVNQSSFAIPTNVINCCGQCINMSAHQRSVASPTIVHTYTEDQYKNILTARTSAPSYTDIISIHGQNAEKSTIQAQTTATDSTNVSDRNREDTIKRRNRRPVTVPSGGNVNTQNDNPTMNQRSVTIPINDLNTNWHNRNVALNQNPEGFSTNDVNIFCQSDQVQVKRGKLLGGSNKSVAVSPACMPKHPINKLNEEHSESKQVLKTDFVFLTNVLLQLEAMPPQRRENVMDRITIMVDKNSPVIQKTDGGEKAATVYDKIHDGQKN